MSEEISTLGKRSFFQAVMDGTGVPGMISQATGIPQPLVEGVIRHSIDTLTRDSQQSVINEAQHQAEALSGGSRRDFERSNISLPGAALIPGRGAELGIANLQFQRPSVMKMKRSGAKMHNAFAEQVKAWGSVDCKMAFAYKAILPVVFVANESPKTRFTTHAFFRHNFSSINAVQWSDVSTNWHKTLGPDDSLIRQASPAGSLSGAAPAGYNTSLRSPYRYPANGDYQMVRMHRPILENIGWNANPCKWVTAAIGSSDNIQTTSPVVYMNSASNQIDTGGGLVSMPGQQPRAMTAGGNEANSTACYYRSQMSEGKVAYQFCNDGTSSVVVDVVITKLKKGKTMEDQAVYTSNMLAAFGQGYLNMTLANRGVINLQGGAPSITDVYENSKVEFLPEKALRYYNKTSVTESTHPYAFVGRDQFIIAAGAVKPWSFSLPAVNYDARDYSNISNQADIIDDLTYCVSISFSTVATPLVESGTVGRAVIDRRGNALNVSVTGTYKETPHPVYLADFVNTFYVNGVLNAPYYTATAPALSRVNILPPETGSRTDADGTSYMVVGPSNTQNAA